MKAGRRVLDRLTLTIRDGEHTALLGPNGAGKSMLVALLTHHERAVPHDDGTPPVKVFGAHRWDVATLRGRLGIVSSSLHQRFVAGNSEGRITGELGPADFTEEKLLKLAMASAPRPAEAVSST